LSLPHSLRSLAVTTVEIGDHHVAYSIHSSYDNTKIKENQENCPLKFYNFSTIFA